MSLLPAGYKRLIYIESVGKQCINTEFYPDQNTRITMVVSEWENTELNARLWGTRSSSSDRYELYVSSGGGYRSYYSGGVVSFDSALSYEGKVNIERNGSRITIGDQTVKNSESTFSCVTPLYLLADNNNGTTNNYASVKLYSCKIYDGETLSRDFIPCINASGEIGLYDAVEKTFYGNAGTGAFVASEEFDDTDSGILKLLPKGYRRLHYIQSSGSQWIDTKYIPKQNTSIIATVKMSNPSAGEYSGLYVSGSAYMMFGTGNSVWEAYMGGAVVGTSAKATSDITVLTLDAKNKKAVFHGQAADVAYGAFTVPTITMPIFTLRQGTNSFRNYANMRLYTYDICEDERLLKSFVPCVNASGEVGLYETVNGGFYGNLGTGAFTAGPDWRYTEAEYIQSSGTQFINTEISLPNGFRTVTDFTMLSAGILIGSHDASSPYYRNFVGPLGTQWMSGHLGYCYFGSAVSGNDYEVDYCNIQGSIKCTINGTAQTLDVSGATEATRSANYMYLLGVNKGNGVSDCLSAKLYSCKVYSDANAENLVGDFVPCVDADGVPCVYDKVSDKLLYNAGTGTFGVGRLRITEYIPLEYIESTGTQYINTGFIPDQDSRVVMDIDTTNAGGQSFPSLFSTDSSSAYKQRFTTMIYTGQDGFHDHYGNAVVNSSNIGVYGRLLVDKNKNITYLNGNAVSNFTYTSFNGTVPLVLLASLDAGVYQYQIKAKLYSCKVYDNGTLLFDFVPIKLLTGEAGLLDRVSGFFYGNAGTGVFTAGPSMPTSYTPLEYIESTGAQYIDTGFKGNQNTRIVVDAQVTTQPSTHAWLFGARNSNTVGARNLFLYSGTTWAADYNSDSTRYRFTNIGALDRVLVDFNKNKITINGSSYTYTAATFQCSYNTVLFGQNNAGAADNFIPARLYSCQIYNNGVATRDFIPVKLDTGVAGLYDNVSGEFFYSATSTPFITGPDSMKAPESPDGVSYEAASGAITLSWDAVEYAEGYNIYRDGKLIATVTDTTFADSVNLVFSYQYAITAFNALGESEPSVVTVRATQTPDAVANIRVTYADFSSINIAWSASVGADGYYVYRDGLKIATTQSTSFYESELETDTAYRYEIKAYNSAGESAAAVIDASTTEFTLVTDRTAADVERARTLAAKGPNMTEAEMLEWLSGMKGAYNYSDFMRVEKAVVYVNDKLNVAGWYKYAVPKLNWSMSDFPSRAEMERYLDNIRLLRSALPTGIPSVPENMDRLNYVNANTIEHILILLDAAVTNIMLNVYYSNEKYCGEV